MFIDLEFTTSSDASIYLTSRLELAFTLRERGKMVGRPIGMINIRMGAAHVLMERLRNVSTEMALSVLAYRKTWSLVSGQKERSSECFFARSIARTH